MPVGVTTPTAEGYFGVNANYKRFSVSINGSAHFGGLKYNQPLVDRVENADPHYNVDVRVFDEKWKQRGDRTFFKNIAGLGTTDVTSRFVQNNNELRLQFVYIAYDIDMSRSFLLKISAKSFKIAFTMNDLWRWGAIKEERGIDYPFAGSATISLQAGF